MLKPSFGYLTVSAVSALIAGAVYLYAERGIEILKAEYQAKSIAEASQGARNVDVAFQHIYQNLRTLASLPGIRGVDRHGQTLSPEARATFQLIYNNLANSVAVSEVYVVPADFSPDRIDPVTGKPEEPIIMFDELILNAGSGLSDDERAKNPEAVTRLENAGPPEVEIFEYYQLKDQAGWYRENYPDSTSISGLRVPIISSGEVITCDNSDYITSNSDSDRSGVILSVPFFDQAGKFKGIVSAVILSNAIRQMLPDENYALVNQNNGYVNTTATVAPHVLSALESIKQAEPAPGLLFSRTIPVSINEPRNPWSVWVGYDNDRFYSNAEYTALQTLKYNGYGLAVILLLAGWLSWFFVMRDSRNSRRAAAALTKARDDAREAEAEATAMTQQFRALNEDVGHLNRELTDKVRQLQEAQDEIVRKGKMAQLGNLTATIAHELRNPMGAIRTTAFLMRRKLKDSAVDVAPLLTRIDGGIGRCDDIITQLLDFARSKTPDFSAVDIDQWVAETVEEEAKSLPETVHIECHLGLGDRHGAIDPERMRRVLVNLLSNAAEAMVGKTGTPEPSQTASPSLTVKTQFTARGIEIAVSDNGPGIDAETLAKIREPLFTTKNFGTGLGIPAVERILELHSGGLDIVSSPGQGACFTAWFPADQQAQQAA